MNIPNISLAIYTALEFIKDIEKLQEKVSKLEPIPHRLQKIEVSEPDNKTALEIIWWLKEVFEEYHNLNINDEAVKEAVNLSTRYITDRFLPDKAIDLIDEACSLKSMNYNFDEKETKKNEQKEKKIEAIKKETPEEKLKTVQDKLLRTMAEMENQRRRFEKEKKEALWIQWATGHP